MCVSILSAIKLTQGSIYTRTLLSRDNGNDGAACPGYPLSTALTHALGLYTRMYHFSPRFSRFIAARKCGARGYRGKRRDATTRLRCWLLVDFIGDDVRETFVL